MFDIKVIDKDNNNLEVSCENAEACVYIISHNGKIESGMLVDCDGMVLTTIYAALKELMHSICDKYEMISLLDSLGIIDKISSELKEVKVSTIVEDGAEVIAFPRKCNEKP